MRPVTVVLVSTLALACNKGESAPAAAPAQPAAAKPAMPTMPTMPGAQAGNGVKGKVLETLSAATYTYLRLQTANGETWAAVPQAAIAVGAEVDVRNPMPMDGFESKTLNRKFDKIVFGTLAGPPAAQPEAQAAPAAAPAGTPAPAMAEMAMKHGAAAAGPADVGEIKVAKAEGPDGRTVAELFGKKGELKDKTVAVRAQVVKVTNGVMGKNWLHLRDGTGTRATNDDDITVTTSGTAAVGDVVLVRGALHVDRDFGSGYAYPLIVEDATVQAAAK